MRGYTSVQHDPAGRSDDRGQTGEGLERRRVPRPLLWAGKDALLQHVPADIDAIVAGTLVAGGGAAEQGGAALGVAAAAGAALHQAGEEVTVRYASVRSGSSDHDDRGAGSPTKKADYQVSFKFELRDEISALKEEAEAVDEEKVVDEEK